MLEKIEEIENEEDGIKFMFKAYCYDKQGKYKDAEAYYLKSSDKGFSMAMLGLANLYQNQERYGEAEKYYLLAINKGHLQAFNNLANLYQNKGKYQDAEKYYLLAIEKGHISSLNGLANLYKKQEKDKDAEKYYLLAIEKGYISSLNGLANLYRKQEKDKDAEKYYVLAVAHNNINALFNLANFYYQKNEMKEASLECITKYFIANRDKLAHLLIIQIWNGIFSKVEEKIEQILNDNKYEDLTSFLENLLYLNQTHLVLSLFESDKHGAALKSRYELLHYATLILANKTEGNLLLKIPPEVLPTVEAIVKTVQEKQVFYAA